MQESYCGEAYFRKAAATVLLALPDGATPEYVAYCLERIESRRGADIDEARALSGMLHSARRSLGLAFGEWPEEVTR